MLGAGSGRGRGWMRLEKNTEPPRPGDEFRKLESSQSQIIQQENNTYNDLIQQFECLDSKDDGILLNEKIKHIRSVFMKSCETEDEITRAMQAIHQKCLTDMEYMKKFVLFITSAFFLNKQTSNTHLNWRNTVRRLFFKYLQENFENRVLLREMKPAIFYNSLELHMSFFRSCRIIKHNGYPSIEAAAITGFLSTLLQHCEPTDIKMFTHMVCENREILIKLYEKGELIEVLNKLKQSLLCDNKLAKNEKLLLFFSWDLIQHKYDLLPEEIKFYVSQMEEDVCKEILVRYNYVNALDMRSSEIVNEQKNHTLSKEDKSVNGSLKLQSTGQSIHEENALDQYAYSSCSLSSSVCENEDVLGNSQVSSLQAGVSKYEINTSSWDIVNDGNTKGTEYSNLNRNKEILNEKHHRSDQPKYGEKIGRPILGVGARLKRN